MHRLIWGFADCWKSHVTAQLYSFEASDAKSDINSCSDPVCLLGPRFIAPDLVWQDLGDLLDPNYFQTLKAGERERERERLREREREKERERERLALAYESFVISKNIMNGC